MPAILEVCVSRFCATKLLGRLLAARTFHTSKILLKQILRIFFFADFFTGVFPLILVGGWCRQENGA